MLVEIIVVIGNSEDVVQKVEAGDLDVALVTLLFRSHAP